MVYVAIAIHSHPTLTKINIKSESLEYCTQKSIHKQVKLPNKVKTHFSYFILNFTAFEMILFHFINTFLNKRILFFREHAVSRKERVSKWGHKIKLRPWSMSVSFHLGSMRSFLSKDKSDQITEYPPPIHNKIQKSRGFRWNILTALSKEWSTTSQHILWTHWPKRKHRDASIFKHHHYSQ